MKLTRQLKGDNWRQSHGFCFHSVKKVSVVLMEQEKKIERTRNYSCVFRHFKVQSHKSYSGHPLRDKYCFDKVIFTDLGDNFVSLGI